MSKNAPVQALNSRTILACCFNVASLYVLCGTAIAVVQNDFLPEFKTVEQVEASQERLSIPVAGRVSVSGSEIGDVCKAQVLLGSIGIKPDPKQNYQTYISITDQYTRAGERMVRTRPNMQVQGLPDEVPLNRARIVECSNIVRNQIVRNIDANFVPPAVILSLLSINIFQGLTGVKLKFPRPRDRQPG